jgi:hypothetical protein
VSALSSSTPEWLPNFLVVGAAKAGTTALHEYLGQHPEVFLPDRQEPSFFAFDGQPINFRGPNGSYAAVNQTAVRSLAEYEALFSVASPGALRGEVSPVYLYWPGTAERIRARLPQVKLCIILRDPANRAFSGYMHAVREGKEPEADFASALAAEPQRIRDNWGFMWRYADLGHYPAQIRRYLDVFPPEQLEIVLYDDLRRDPAALCQRLFRFVGADPAFRPDTSVRHNVSGRPRSRGIHDLLRRDGPLRGVARTAAPILGRERLRRAQARLSSANLAEQTFPAQQRAQLVAAFRSEVEELAELIGRDLQAWLEIKESGAGDQAGGHGDDRHS